MNLPKTESWRLDIKELNEGIDAAQAAARDDGAQHGAGRDGKSSTLIMIAGRYYRQCADGSLRPVDGK